MTSSLNSFEIEIELYLNDFYDPNLEADFTRHDDTFGIRTISINSSSIDDENWSNVIDNWSIYMEITILYIYISSFLI